MNCPLCGSDVVPSHPLTGLGSIVFCTDSQCPAYEWGLEVSVGFEDVVYLEPIIPKEEKQKTCHKPLK